MLVFALSRDLKNGKQYTSMLYQKVAESEAVENRCHQEELKILRQGEVEEQIKSHLAPLSQYLEDLNKPIQDMTQKHRMNTKATTGFRAHFASTGTSCDI